MSEFNNEIHRLISDLLDYKNSVAFRPALARSLGATAALFLSQAIYWQNKKGIGEWFYKNRDAYRRNEVMIEPGTTIKRTSGDGEVKDFVVQQSWEWELGLSRSEQETARRKLVKLGLLEEKDQGIPCKKHFRVNLDKTIDFLLKNQQLAESCQLDGEIQPTSRRNHPNRLDGNTPTITKTTSKITHTETAAAAPHAQACGTVPSAAASSEKRKHPQRTRNGIECWYPAEDDQANEIETKFSDEHIAAAVRVIRSRKNRANKPTSPVPVLVEEELMRQESERKKAAAAADKIAADAAHAETARKRSDMADELLRQIPSEQRHDLEQDFFDSMSSGERNYFRQADRRNSNSFQIRFRSWLLQRFEN